METAINIIVVLSYVVVAATICLVVFLSINPKVKTGQLRACKYRNGNMIAYVYIKGLHKDWDGKWIAEVTYWWSDYGPVSRKVMTSDERQVCRLDVKSIRRRYPSVLDI